MNGSTAQPDELQDLLVALIDGETSSEEHERLSALLRDSAEARQCYLLQVTLHARLQKRIPHLVANGDGRPAEGLVDAARAEIEDASLALPVNFLGNQEGSGFRVQGAEALSSRSPSLSQSSPPTIHYPLSTALGYFSSGWPVAYLVATVIFGIGLLIGALVHVSTPVQVVQQSVPSPSSLAPSPSSEMESVGRITGMVDCQWSDSSTAVPVSVAVPVGRKYTLDFGLLEITYDTGAKVILEGPCTYEVESSAGGFLSVGKLTAKVETKGSRAGLQGSANLQISKSGSQVGSPVGSSSSVGKLTALVAFEDPGFRVQDSDSANLQSSIPNPLFTVRTPTATVTDLGTEFGIEVDKQGSTMSHVFRGSVKLQATAPDNTTDSAARVLRENESAQVKLSGDAGNRVANITTLPSDSLSKKFIRDIPSRTIRTFDLVDVVAGGDGFSGRRNRGIDPTTGRTVDAPPERKILVGDGRYHRVEGLSFVDGVFIPDGRRGPVQTDSAGHTFDAFVTAFNETWHCAWAGGAIPSGTPRRVLPTLLGGVDYSSPGHGLLYMHANKGITFDLDAIRRANPGYKLVRFHTVVGNTETAAVLAFSGDTSAKTILFSDDFQSATVGAAPDVIAGGLSPAVGSRVAGTWKFHNGALASAQVRNDASPGNVESGAGANRYLALTRPTSDDRSSVLATGWPASSTEEQIVQQNLSIYVPSGPAIDAFYFVALTTDRVDASSRAFGVCQYQNGEVKFHDGRDWRPTTLIGKFDVWQNVVVTADMAAKKYSIRLDGDVYNDAYWQGDATTIGCLLMTRPLGAAGGKAFIDNVCLQTSPKPSTFEKSNPASASADAWVLVDGQRRSGRRGINRDSGANSIVIPIAEGDRFLTLVATDGGNGLYWDSVLFGDPRLELRPTTGMRQ